MTRRGPQLTIFGAFLILNFCPVSFLVIKIYIITFGGFKTQGVIATFTFFEHYFFFKLLFGNLIKCSWLLLR